jgi:hypothetical protein
MCGVVTLTRRLERVKWCSSNAQVYSCLRIETLEILSDMRKRANGSWQAGLRPSSCAEGGAESCHNPPQGG